MERKKEWERGKRTEEEENERGGKGKGMVEQERGRGREGKGEEKVWFASLTHIGSENAISQYIYEWWDWGGGGYGKVLEIFNFIHENKAFSIVKPPPL